MITVFTEGSSFGEMALYGETRRTVTVLASNYCDLDILMKEEFLKVVEEFPSMQEKIRLSITQPGERSKAAAILLGKQSRGLLKENNVAKTAADVPKSVSASTPASTPAPAPAPTTAMSHHSREGETAVVPSSSDSDPIDVPLKKSPSLRVKIKKWSGKVANGDPLPPRSESPLRCHYYQSLFSPLTFSRE